MNISAHKITKVANDTKVRYLIFQINGFLMNMLIAVFLEMDFLNLSNIPYTVVRLGSQTRLTLEIRLLLN